jgi:hypothetical protein
VETVVLVLQGQVVPKQLLLGRLVVLVVGLVY